MRGMIVVYMLLGFAWIAGRCSLSENKPDPNIALQEELRKGWAGTWDFSDTCGISQNPIGLQWILTDSTMTFRDRCADTLVYAYGSWEVHPDNSGNSGYLSVYTTKEMNPDGKPAGSPVYIDFFSKSADSVDIAFSQIQISGYTYATEMKKIRMIMEK